MNDNVFEVYLNNVIKMVQTMTIKSEYTAKRINDKLRDFKGFNVDQYDPYSWKYYLNLSGQYHPTDTKMYVKSSDDLSTIEFNSPNLYVHKKTSRDYAFGTRQYEELLKSYPDQEDIIHGVLYPIDIDYAIKADDHSIIQVLPGLIEPNEYTLMEDMNRFTKIYFKRYYNDQYTISDDLYYGTSLSMYYMNMIMFILTERAKRHKTIEAHSFYIKQYLASNSGLGNYHDFMTLPQALYFYKNIKYHQRHPGKNETFYKLIEELMTKRAIPSAEYEMFHDVKEQTSEIYPTNKFRLNHISTINSNVINEIHTLNHILEKEEKDAFMNREEISYNRDRIDRFLKDSPSDKVEIKLLDSTMIDLGETTTYKLEDIQIAHWLYYANKGIYTSVVNIVNPITTELIVLDTTKAYILASYALLKSLNFDPVYIPMFGAQRVLRTPVPTHTDLLSIIDKKYVNDWVFNTAYSKVTEVAPLISIDSFYLRCKEVFDIMNFHRDLVAMQENMHSRNEVYKLINRFTADVYIKLVPDNTTYGSWLFANNLNFNGFSRFNYEELFNTIVNAAIGTTINTTPSLRNVQKAMTATLKSLTSYSVQFSNSISDESVKITDLPSIRVGDQLLDGENTGHVRVTPFDVFSQKQNAILEESVGIWIQDDDIYNQEINVNMKNYVSINNGPQAVTGNLMFQHQVPIKPVGLGLVNKPNVSNYPQPLQNLMGMDLWLGLNQNDKDKIYDKATHPPPII